MCVFFTEMFVKNAKRRPKIITDYIPNIKALGHVLSDKNSFENCILKTYFLTL